MLILNERDSERLWKSGITTEQYDVAYDLMKKATIKGKAESAIIYNLKRDSDFKKEWWFKSLESEIRITCKGNSNLDYDEIMNEIVEFATDIQRMM